ncbi:T9SS type A sorting domain-containing protein [Algibacter pectinivorans]|uniref:Por secretion system C-terminal sorting domain-containing protein n=1 Tax=Algibacter pectinivorans TaxID=870482 RepID=A0A1I1QQW3_9FLAO|nr:T9SS type A sorting domain-containing protein [Algibacter pectinivorans]SFD24439.1 Por secretion system C-terminal sorting domain-containing protein [Algibacter pectinivorans]
MKKSILPPQIIYVFVTLQLLLFSNYMLAQNQEECFDYNKTALFTGLWFGDGETRFENSKVVDGVTYHGGKIWAIKEYRDEVVEAFGDGYGIEGIYWDLERYEDIKNELNTTPPPTSAERTAIVKRLNNIIFWVHPDGPFKDFDPTHTKSTSPIIPAPAEVVDTRSKILSWMMGVVYTEGFRGGRIIDDRGDNALDKMQKAFDLIKTVGFETATLTREDKNTSIPKYAIKIKEPDFKILQALPFRRWHRVPGMPAAVNGEVPPPADVEQYPSCVLNVNSISKVDNLIIKNPINQGGSLTIRLPNGLKSAECQIFDIHGKVIDKFNISDNVHIYPEAAKLNNGFYFVKVYFAGQVRSIKLIIK